MLVSHLKDSILVGAYFENEEAKEVDALCSLLYKIGLIEDDNRSAFVRYAIRFLKDFMAFYPDMKTIEKSRVILADSNQISKDVAIPKLAAMFTQYMSNHIVSKEGR